MLDLTLPSLAHVPNVRTEEPTVAEKRRQFFGYCKDLAGLLPTGRVLDVGCGRGFLAEALYGYLKNGGSYEGFDTVEENIAGCRRRFASRGGAFRFTSVDLKNRNYNPGGRLRACEYRFPFAAEGFDLVVLRSVFTHMLPEDFEQYVHEIRRLLVPGGRSLTSFFLLNDESLRRMRAKVGVRIFFPHAYDDFATQDPGQEGAVAYREDYVRRVFARNRLQIREPIRYGYWCGRVSEWTSQDLILATRPS